MEEAHEVARNVFLVAGGVLTLVTGVIGATCVKSWWRWRQFRGRRQA